MKKLFATTLVFLSSVASAGSATLSWTAPTQYEDGSALPASELANYKIYYGNSTGVYSGFITVSAATTSYTVNNLTSGLTYYFVVTAVATNAQESVYSNEGVKVIPSTKKPKSPTGLR